MDSCPVDALPAIRVRGKILIRRSEVDMWLANHRIASLARWMSIRSSKTCSRASGMGVKVRRPKGHASWCVVIDHEGYRKTKAVGTREAAERVKREIEARLALGGLAALEPARPGVPTLTEYSATWLKTLEFGRKPSTTAF